MSQSVKKFDFNGVHLADLELPSLLADGYANPQMIKDYVVAIRHNLRQWSANTKGKWEVSHSNQKPHKQKGTGRARQGSLASPQYKGGGRVFGPKPKFDQHVRINKKERRAIIHYLLAEKAKSGELIIVEDPVMVAPKTQEVVRFLKTTHSQGKVLFVLEAALEQFMEGIAPVSVPSAKYDLFRLSIRNLPTVRSALTYDLNGYQLLSARRIVMTATAWEQLGGSYAT